MLLTHITTIDAIQPNTQTPKHQNMAVIPDVQAGCTVLLSNKNSDCRGRVGVILHLAGKESARLLWGDGSEDTLRLSSLTPFAEARRKKTKRSTARSGGAAQGSAGAQDLRADVKEITRLLKQIVRLMTEECDAELTSTQSPPPHRAPQHI